MHMSVYVVVGCSGERRLGDLEVSLTLEDLGPIVQPTIQLDAEQKLVRAIFRITVKLMMKSPVRVVHDAAAALNFISDGCSMML